VPFVRGNRHGPCAFAENQIGGGRAVARQFSDARKGSSSTDVTIKQSPAAEPNLESLSANQKGTVVCLIVAWGSRSFAGSDK
jgi:hypothetical protein